MRMHNRPHPGEILRELFLEPLDLSVRGATQALSVSRKALSAILNGRAGISPELGLAAIQGLWYIGGELAHSADAV